MKTTHRDASITFFLGNVRLLLRINSAQQNMEIFAMTPRHVVDIPFDGRETLLASLAEHYSAR